MSFICGNGNIKRFRMRCLRNILKIKWQDRAPHTEVPRSAGIQSQYPILASDVAWVRCADR